MSVPCADMMAVTPSQEGILSAAKQPHMRAKGQLSSAATVSGVTVVLAYPAGLIAAQSRRVAHVGFFEVSMGIQLFRCERMSARNRYGVRGATNRGTIPPRWACEGCPGLELDAVSTDTEAMMAKPVRGTCPSCKRENVLLTSKGGTCHRCYRRAREGRDPLADTCSVSAPPEKQPVGPPAPVIVPPPAVEPAAEAAPPLSLPDPRVTFECPHCQSVLSSAEVERCDCPVCGKQLHTHVDRAGEVFTVTDIAPDGAFVVKPDTPAHTTAVVTNMDGDRVDFGVDVLVVAAIREAMRDLEASWLTDLSGLSPSRAICETYRKIEQLQTLRG